MASLRFEDALIRLFGLRVPAEQRHPLGEVLARARVELVADVQSTDVTIAGPRNGKNVRQPRRRPSSAARMSLCVRSVRLCSGVG